ncbi:hypothetical protein ANN_06162 [Periplaneta americana]|uniref:Uncharacterized protein n=1 Tax=Periplaneta americana TaxID=6978 RepID=A0ABQ8TCU3_PERAM|nr:hypothetical protein ANN_06162 [Periplaneta americana]
MEQNGECEVDRQNKKLSCARKIGLRKNNAETDKEEKNKLTGLLAKEKLPTEGCTGGNGEREKSSEQKKISDDIQDTVYVSYGEAKTENRKDLKMLDFHADKNSIKHTTMRVLPFLTISPGISLPPQPVLIRWKTWLDAVNYYAKYYGKIMEVIDALDNTDSSAVAAVKSLPSEQLLEDILFIDSNFKIVSKIITLLESSKLQLSEALNIVYKVSQTVIQNNNSLISEKVKLDDNLGVVKYLPIEAKTATLSDDKVTFSANDDSGYNCSANDRFSGVVRASINFFVEDRVGAGGPEAYQEGTWLSRTDVGNPPVSIGFTNTTQDAQWAKKHAEGEKLEIPVSGVVKTLDIQYTDGRHLCIG